MKFFQLPKFMSSHEAREIALRLLDPAPVDDRSKLLGVALLYTSWEFETPTSVELAAVLRAIPDYLRALPLDAPGDLLRLSPARVREAMDTEKAHPELAKTLHEGAVWHDELLRDRPALSAVLARLLDWLGDDQGPTPQETTAAEASVGTTEIATVPGLVVRGPSFPQAPAALPPSPGGRIALYTKAEVTTQWQRLPAEEPSLALRRLLLQMEKGNPSRSLTPAPEPGALAPLLERFPHFSHVVAFVRQCLALACTGTEGKPVAIAPLLLRGAPGTGKSYFAQELAAALGCVYQERDLSVTSEAFVLMGMDSTWKGGKPGLVFDALFHGTTANPVLCLNEVDKAKAPGGFGNSPLAALYTLLEPANSRQFRDEFSGVSVDASKIVWVLTANDGHLPEPILSRLEVFDIPAPSPSQCLAIARSVWRDLLRKDFPAGHPFAEDLPETIVERVAVLSPREMRKTLYRAAGVAAMAGRTQVHMEDVSAAVGVRTPPPRMGFIA